MRIGFSLLNNQGIDDAKAMVELAIRAEALGFDSVWTHDHVFNVGHVFDRIGGKPYYEPLTVLSHVAARTERVRLGTSVLVLPYHNPIRLAKTAATLDVLSGGRLTMGVGVGSIEKETTAMGAPFAERGAFTDEAIAVMRTLWSEEDPKFEGKFWRFAGMKFSLFAVDAFAGGLVVQSLVAYWFYLRWGLSPEALGQSMATLRDEARACGRDAAKIPISIAMTLGASTRGRATLGRAPAEIVKHARAYAELGVETLAISAGTSDPKEARSALEMLAREVLPAIPERGQ